MTSGNRFSAQRGSLDTRHEKGPGNQPAPVNATKDVGCGEAKLLPNRYFEREKAFQEPTSESCMAILAIDQGTTGTTCMLYDESGCVLARAYRELTQIYPRAGWVEHDPEEIWKTVVDCVARIRSAYSGSIDAIGITNQGRPPSSGNGRAGVRCITP